MKLPICTLATSFAALISARAIAQCDAWAPLATAGNAPSGYTFGWAYDSLRDRVVALSGAVGSQNPLREYDGTTWELKSPAVTPPPLAAMPMVFDSLRGRCMLVGGLLNNSTQFVDGHWNGTAQTGKSATFRDREPGPLAP